MDQTTTPEVTTEQPGLTIQDLTLTLQVIQVATNRGAFKAEELTAIGGLYDRIVKFLDAAGALKPAEIAPEEAAPAVEKPKAKGKTK